MSKDLVLLLFLPLLGFANSAQFGYQGRLFDDLGEPVDSGTTEITVQVLNPSTDCLLYEESHDVDMNGKQGFFSISIGGGTQNVATAPSFSLTAALSNRATLAGPNMNCPGNSYSPGVTDSRMLKILVNGTPLTPAQILNPTPYSMIANDAEKLGGKSATDFIQDDAGNVTQTNLQNFFDTASTLGNNQTLRWNAGGSNWEVFTPGAAGAGINSVTAGAGINVSGTVNDPIIAINESAIDYTNIANTPDLAGDGTSSIHFNNLTNVPSDIADGDDDTTYSNATAVVAGLMSTTDKSKLDGLDDHSLNASDGLPTDALFVDNDGKVGVGLTVPNAELSVEGAISLDQLGSDPTGAMGYGTLFAKTDGNLYFRDETGAINNLTGDGGGDIGVMSVVHETANNTHGDTLANGTWTIRTLNVVKHNTITGASLSSNQITLPAGKFSIVVSGGCKNNSGSIRHWLHRIYDTTNTSTVMKGSKYRSSSSSYNSQGWNIEAVVQPSSPTVYQIEGIANGGNVLCNQNISVTGDSEAEVNVRVLITEL